MPGEVHHDASSMLLYPKLLLKVSLHSSVNLGLLMLDTCR